VTSELARIGGPVGCLGLAVLFVAPTRPARLAGLTAWAAGALALVAFLAPHGHRAVLAAAGVVGLVLAAAGAATLRRWPWALALAVLACAPARIPVTVGGTKANLLVPLYGVVAAAALALGWELSRGDRRYRELGPFAWPLAAFVAWSGLTLAWTGDLREGSIELLFFYLPFGLLAVGLARLPWRGRWLVALYVQLVAMALAFAAIGVYQWATRDVFWNPKVIVGNAYAPFYRVNSIFWDPSIYGRFLVLAILASLVLVLFGRGRVALYPAAAIAAIWLGLLFSFSQSSFAALIAGVVAAAAVAWRWRAVAALVLVGAVMLTVGVSAPQVRHSLLGSSGVGLNSASSGRLKLVSNGAKIALHHPHDGVGIGGFKRAYAKRLHLRGKEPKSAASHDTPITVAAETGLPGLALLAWLLLAYLRNVPRGIPGTFRDRAILIAALLLGAIAVHSLFYDAFFEDPLAWGLIALLVLGIRQEPLKGKT
jgi:putative inorganic carbon (HCO3(-)) transporter